MKPLPLVFALAIALLSSAHGEVPDFSKPVQNGYRIDAKETASSNHVVNKGVWWDGYDRAFFSSKTISVLVGSFGQVAPSTTLGVDIYWFAKKVQGNQMFLFAVEHQPVDLGGFQKTVNFKMPVLGSTEVNYGLGARYVAGSKFAGWLVVLHDGPSVYQTRSSSPTIHATTQDQGSFASMVAEYERQHGAGPGRNP